MAEVFYHWTQPDLVPAILADGLRLDAGGRPHFCIYLARSPVSWAQPGLVLLEVAVPSETPVHTCRWMDESVLEADIPSEWIKPAEADFAAACIADCITLRAHMGIVQEVA